MKILHIIDSLSYSGSSTQVQLLGPALIDCDTSVHVCALGEWVSGPDSLRRSGVQVHALGWKRWFDFTALWNLRRLVRTVAPNVIHVWRRPALRALAAVAPEWLPRVVMSAPLPEKGDLAWWDRHLLKQVRCVAVAGASDQMRCLRQGIPGSTLRVIPAAISVAAGIRENARRPGMPSIVCVGNLERDEGFRQAIWAFDFVRQVYPDLTLCLVGAGSQQAALRSLAHGLQADSVVDFVGPRPEVAGWLAGADVVWVPSQANCGRQVALEAMALGRAVVASAVPCLDEVIDDGATGFLVPVGDVLSFGRRTHALFQDDQLRERIGARARAYVRQRYSLPETVERWRELYRAVAA